MWSNVMNWLDKWFAKHGEYRRREALRNELIRIKGGFKFQGAHMHGSGAVVVLSSGDLTVLVDAMSHQGRTYGQVHLPYRVPDGVPLPSFETEDGSLQNHVPFDESAATRLVFQARGPELFERHGTIEACHRLLATIPAILPLLSRCARIDVTTRIEELIQEHDKYLAIKAKLAH